MRQVGSAPIGDNADILLTVCLSPKPCKGKINGGTAARNATVTYGGQAATAHTADMADTAGTGADAGADGTVAAGGGDSGRHPAPAAATATRSASTCAARSPWPRRRRPRPCARESSPPAAEHLLSLDVEIRWQDIAAAEAGALERFLILPAISSPPGSPWQDGLLCGDPLAGHPRCRSRCARALPYPACNLKSSRIALARRIVVRRSAGRTSLLPKQVR